MSLFFRRFLRAPAGEKSQTQHPASCTLQVESLESRFVLTAGAELEVLAPLQDDAAEVAEVAPNTDDTYTTADAAGSTFDTAFQVGELNGTVSFDDLVYFRDSRDFYQFELTQTSEVEISLTNLSRDIDLYLYDANGNLLAQSIRGGSASESIVGELSQGTYYALVTPYGWSASYYTLTLSATPQAAPPPPDTAGESFSTALDLGSLDGSSSLQEYVGPEDAADYFRFQVDLNAEFSASLTELQDDVDLYLLDEQGQILEYSTRAGSSSEAVTANLQAGTYYLVTVPWGDAESTYTLSLDVTLDAPSEPPPDSGDPDEVNPFPDVPDYGGSNDWNLNAINAPEVWAQGYTGQNVIVAVIDTGVDYTHSDLNSNIWVNPGEIAGDGIDNDGNGYVDDVRGWDFVNNDNDPMDANGHGSHVAGTIAAENNGYGATGVAYSALIMPVQVLSASGSGSSLGVADGIRYAAANGADIINLSLGGGYSSSILAAIQYAESLGVFVVAAAGNEGASTPGYPAGHSATESNVLSVGAHDNNNNLASFSNRVGNSGAVQIDAPGVSIYSLYPGNRYARFSGTSMATPHVAGIAALALSANSNLTPSQLRAVLTDGANQTINGSDSIGGANAAYSVALAAAGVTGSVSGSGSVDGSQSGWFGSLSLDNAGGQTPAFSFQADSPTEQTNTSFGPNSPDIARDEFFSDEDRLEQALQTSSDPRLAELRGERDELETALDSVFAQIEDFLL